VSTTNALYGGMLQLRRPVLSLLLVVATGRAETSLENAFRAQALLGPEVWSQVIAVQNDSRGGVYPRTVHALVFELAGILWFYADVNGTQSFSLRYGQLEAEKADFGALLHAVDPGFVRWVQVEAQPKNPGDHRRPLPNGCFIESVVAWREISLRTARA